MSVQISSGTESMSTADIILATARGEDIPDGTGDRVPPPAAEPEVEDQVDAGGEQEGKVESKEVEPEVPEEEEIEVTDDAGRRKVKVNYKDREKIQKAYKMAAGMRKAFAERDKLNRQLEANSAELQKVQTRFQKLEEAWNKSGPEGIIDLLSGEEGASRKWYESRREREERLASASPEERAVYERDEALQSANGRIADLEKRLEDTLKKVETERETAERLNTESLLHPAFSRFGFDGKLGSPEDEHMLNEMLWTRATGALDELQASGVAITKDTVEQQFKKYALAISRITRKEGEKRAETVIAQKKQEAKASVQKALSSKMREQTDEEREAHQALGTDVRGFFRNFGKYGKYF